MYVLLAMENNCEPNPCEGGGICQDRLSGYYCVCPPGLTGTRCTDGVYRLYYTKDFNYATNSNAAVVSKRVTL